MKIIKNTFVAVLIGFACLFIAQIQAMQPNQDLVDKEKGVQTQHMLKLLVQNAGQYSNNIQAIAQNITADSNALVPCIVKMRFNDAGLINLCQYNGLLQQYFFQQLAAIKVCNQTAVDADDYDDSSNMLLAEALLMALQTFFDPEKSDFFDVTHFSQLKDFTSYTAGEFKEKYPRDFDWENPQDPISTMLSTINNPNPILQDQTLGQICDALNKTLRDVKKPDQRAMKLANLMIGTKEWLTAHFDTVVLPLVATSAVGQSCYRNHGVNYDDSIVVSNDLNCSAQYKEVIVTGLVLYFSLLVFTKVISKICH